MAWVVKADAHYPVDPVVDYNKDGILNDIDYSFMWQFSCVQFMLCTGAPDASKPGTYQTSQWSGNYLEVGLSIMPDGTSYKIAWSKPVGGENLTLADWDFVGVRDEAAKTTTYEVRIPWVKSGIKTVGNNAQFGLAYAVSDQQDFNVERSMCEWQDAILGGKNMDNGAVITLAGKIGPIIKPVTINGNYIENITDKMTLIDLKHAFSENISIKDTKGNVITGSTLIGTGSIVRYNGVDYTAIINGDINGDGLVDAKDYLMVKRVILGTFTISTTQLKAACMNGTSTPTSKDYLMIKRHFLGTFNLYTE
jgi:hypothetical protein